MQVISLNIAGDSGVTYHIDTDRHGAPRCTCPAFHFGGRRPCKHILFVTEKLALAPVAPVG